MLVIRNLNLISPVPDGANEIQIPYDIRDIREMREIRDIREIRVDQFNFHISLPNIQKNHHLYSLSITK